jgi:hypothetical protein
MGRKNVEARMREGGSERLIKGGLEEEKIEGRIIGSFFRKTPYQIFPDLILRICTQHIDVKS